MGINFDANPLKNVSNFDIMNGIRDRAPLSYQERIPAADRGNIKETVKTLTSHRPYMNQFIDAFINRIGLTVARTDAMWENPLAQFKQGNLAYGDTIQEYKVGLLKAKTYDPDRESTEEDIWGTERPNVEVNYHTRNRMDKYKFTVNQDMLRAAFLEEGGLSTLIAQIMEAPVTSDNWDEFLLTMSLVREYESNGGYYHMRIPEVSKLGSTEADAKYALRRMRELASTLPFLSTKYNAAHMPAHCSPADMLLLATPAFKAAIDVEALAAAFNLDKMDNPYSRVITVPKEYFGVDHCEAILTTKDHFVLADTLRENTSLFNPDNLNTNYWHHHHGVYSVSRFTPAVMFSTKYDDEQIVIESPVTGISAITFLADEDGTVPTGVNRGDWVALDVAPTVTGAPREGVMWAVTSGVTSMGTFVTPTGVLHVGGDETSTTITVKAFATWVNPADPTAKPFEATLAVPVVGGVLPEWPDDHTKPTDLHADGNDDSDGDGAPDATDAAPKNPKVK